MMQPGNFHLPDNLPAVSIAATSGPLNAGKGLNFHDTKCSMPAAMLFPQLDLSGLRLGEVGLIGDAGGSGWIRLGDLTYQLEQECLLNPEGEVIYLRPQSSMVLAVLAQNLGTIVTKDTLIREVWPDVNVTDDSLTQCIADIRRALDDKSRRILQTIPKKGFILKSTLHENASGKSAMQNALFPDDDYPYQPTRSALLLAAFQVDDNDDSSTGKLNLLASQDSLRQMSTIHRGGQMVDVTEHRALFEFEDATQALRYGLDLCSKTRSKSPSLSSIAQACCVGVDLLPKHAATANPRSVGNNGTKVAELSAIARVGQVVVSVDVRDQCYDALDLEFEDLGEQPIAEGGKSLRAFRAHFADNARRLIPNLAVEDILPTIAIMPLSARSNSGRNIIGELIADDIISALSRSIEVNVISRMSTSAFKSQESNLKTIGTMLSADFVLSGTFSNDENRVAMMLEFAEVSSGKVMWTDRLEVSVASLLGDIETVDKVVSKIRKAIALNEVRRARSNPLPTLRNYTLLIGAVGLMHRLLPSDFELAGRMLKTLIERSPFEPSALSWMARWHVLRVQQGWSDDPKNEAQLALACSRRALDIDPGNSLALTSEGFVLTNLMHQLDDAEDRYNAALEANPNDANGRLLRGTLYAFQGRGEEARRDGERALHLAPLDPHRFFFLALAAGANLAAEDYERTIALAKESLRMNRTHTSTLRVKAVAHMRLGQEMEARETSRELMRLQPNLTISEWLRHSPSAQFEIGKKFAETLRETGVPD